jgi:hypothetical protein
MPMDLAKVIHYQLAYNVYSLWHVSHTTLSSLVNAIQVKIYFEVLMHFFAFFIIIVCVAEKPSFCLRSILWISNFAWDFGLCRARRKARSILNALC